MRDLAWLKRQLDYLLTTYFSDVKVTNPIEVRFGREAKFRFGSIKLVKKGIKGSQGTTSKRKLIFAIAKSTSLLPRFLKARGTRDTHITRGTLKASEVPQKSVITITRMFASEEVPADVVVYTIAHELCHYAHGFSSSNKRLFRHPHHGGVVNKEITDRGGKHLIVAYKKWIREYRKKILAGRTRI